MGKQYKAELAEIAIVDGKIVGCAVTDNFSSQNDTTKESRPLENVTFTLDGLEIETAVKFLWDALKVKAQTRTWKNMTDADFTALDGGTHSILDYIPKAERTSSKKAIVNSVYQAQTKAFYEKALEQAVEQADDSATQEEIIAIGQSIFDKEYKPLLDMMIASESK